MKKRVKSKKIFLSVILLFLLPLVFAAVDPEAASDFSDDNPLPLAERDIQEPGRNTSQPYRVLNGTANAEQNFRDSRQEFEQYRIFLFLDKAFQQTSIVSRVLFGMHYEFELKWALAIAFWLLFLIFIPGIIRNLSGWTTFTSSLLALALNIVLAQIMVFKGLSLVTIGLIRQGSIIGIIFFLILLALLVGLFVACYIIANMVKKRRDIRKLYLTKLEKNIPIGGPPPEEDYQRA